MEKSGYFVKNESIENEPNPWLSNEKENSGNINLFEPAGLSTSILLQSVKKSSKTKIVSRLKIDLKRNIVMFLNVPFYWVTINLSGETEPTLTT